MAIAVKRARLIFAILGCTLVVAAASGVYAQRARRQREARVLAEKNAHQASVDALTRELAAATEAVRSVREELVSATNESTRAAAQSKLAKAELERRTAELKLAALQGLPAPPPPARTGCACVPGDPLCSLL